MQCKPFRRLAPGRLTVHNFHRLESERANSQYLASCLTVPLLTDTFSENGQLATDELLVPPKQLLSTLSSKEISNELNLGRNTAFCSKRSLLKLKHSMRPQQLEVLVLPSYDSTNTAGPLYEVPKLEIPFLPDLVIKVNLALPIQQNFSGLHGVIPARQFTVQMTPSMVHRGTCIQHSGALKLHPENLMSIMQG